MADGKVVIDIEANDSDLEKELKDVEDSAQDAGKKLEDLGDGARDAGKGLDAVDVAAGNLVTDGINNLISSLGNAVVAVMGLAEATREYREDMAKLDAAFTTAGHTTDTAGKTYEDFYAILGESDRSVEAVNHLAELTNNTEELSKWSTIAAGVTAKFGDSLPIEGLTEAANETAKVGKVTGPLADALNWAGISEDAFNEKLAACNSEQERATLITETLNEKYKAAADEYNELTAETQAARRATSDMETAQANLGAAIEPVTTAWTRLKAKALEAILPVVQTVAGWLTKLEKWMDENPQKAEVVKAVVIGIAAALGVLVVAFGTMSIIKTVTAAFKSLNVTMLANPITWIVALIAGLVAAFIYLWNNCEGFRNFWINLWAKVKTAAGSVATWFKTTWNNVLVWLRDAVSKIGGFFSSAWAKIKAIVNTWRSFFVGVWNGIKNVFANVGSWFSSKFSDAKNRVLNAFSGIKTKFNTIGDNIVKGIWNGINNGYSWIKGKIKGWVGDVLSFVKKLFGIKSPSTVFRDEIGKMLPAGMSVGFEAEMPKVEQQMAGDIDALTAKMQATVAAESIKVGNGYAAQYDGTEDIVRAVGMQTAGINSLASEYRRGSSSKQPVVLMVDKRELGRAVVDVSSAENVRVGLSYA